MFNLLSSMIQLMPVLENPYELNFIGKFIQILLEGLPSMGLGIIVFTIILKLITLPLDIYSRVSMKKNNIKMEKMRPQLEKLQRQYANNQAMYNQKIQALYKKEGYSALSSCLPTLVTLVVFIIVINQFSNYSNYANLTLIEGMVNNYNTAIESFVKEDNSGEVIKVGNEYYINQSLIFTDEDLQNAGVVVSYDENGQAIYTAEDINKFANYLKKLNDNNYTGVTVEKNLVLDEHGNYSFSKAEFDPSTLDIVVNQYYTNKVFSDQSYNAMEVIKEVARESAAEYYRENVPSFLWVKNIWVEDLVWKHPVKQSFSEYKFTVRKGCKAIDAGINLSDVYYSELTSHLSAEKEQPNGYLILVILSIGIMVVSQIVMNKTQKAQMELQSVNNNAAQTSKMMTWMMPIMFGFFAFIYTASFSIYMVISSLLSTLSTIIINKIVETKYNKQALEETKNNDKRFHHTNKNK